MSDVLESRWYSLQNEIHGFFAVLPLKWQRPRQHLKLGEKTQKNVIGVFIYVIFTLSQYVFSSLPLVPRTTTSRRCGCVPACSRPLVPCTPQCHRRNKLSSHDQWLLYTGRNLKTHKTLTKDLDPYIILYSSTIIATKSFNMKQFSHKSSVKATS